MHNIINIILNNVNDISTSGFDMWWFYLNWTSKHLIHLEKFLYFHDLIPISIGIFLIGFLGFIEASDFVLILINTELMMLGINFYLITISLVYSSYLGQVYSLCFLSLTAAETAIGLGLLITLYRIKGSIQFIETSGLKF